MLVQFRDDSGHPTCQKLGQVLLLLCFVAIPDDLVDAEVAVCPIAKSNRSRRPAQLLQPLGSKM